MKELGKEIVGIKLDQKLTEQIVTNHEKQITSINERESYRAEEVQATIKMAKEMTDLLIYLRSGHDGDEDNPSVRWMRWK